MKRALLAGFCVGLVLACSTTQLQTPAGQLFCSLQLAGGGAIVVTAVDAEASALAPTAAPVAVIATGLAKATVDAACAQAAKNYAGAISGAAVSPPVVTPTAPLPAVAVTVVKTP